MSDGRRKPDRNRRLPGRMPVGGGERRSRFVSVMVGLLCVLLVVKFVIQPLVDDGEGAPLDLNETIDRLERLLQGEPAEPRRDASLNQRLLTLPPREARELISRLGADAINAVDSGMTPIMTAASAGRADLIAMLVEHGGDPNRRGGQERTALQYAAERNRIEAARVLLAAGADVDGHDTTRLTPLVMAADRGYTELAFLFLDAGADVDIAHVEGWTALIDAARAGNVELVKRLLYEGADSALATPNGWRAVDYARHYKHAEVVRILEKHG